MDTCGSDPDHGSAILDFGFWNCGQFMGEWNEGWSPFPTRRWDRKLGTGYHGCLSSSSCLCNRSFCSCVARVERAQLESVDSSAGLSNPFRPVNSRFAFCPSRNRRRQASPIHAPRSLSGAVKLSTLLFPHRDPLLLSDYRLRRSSTALRHLPIPAR